MPVVDYKYYQVLKYDAFGNNVSVIPKKYIKNIDSLEVSGIGRCLNGIFTADAKLIGIEPFDVIIVRVSDDPAFLTTNTALYRGQYLVLGNKKKTSLSQFQTIGLEDSLRYIKPTQRSYGQKGALTDVADIVIEIVQSLLGIMRPSNNTPLYDNLYKYNVYNFPSTGVSVEEVTLITESYYDLLEYCKKLTGDLNVEWWIDAEGFIHFQAITSNDIIDVNEETKVQWKDINCANYVNTVDFYIPTNNDTDALEYRVVNSNALDANNDLKYPERRKTYLLSSDLLTPITYTNQYYSVVNQVAPAFNPLIPNVDIMGPNPSNTHNQFQMYSPYTPGSPYYPNDPQLAFTLTDKKNNSYVEYPVYNNVGPFNTLNPQNLTGIWQWKLGTLSENKVIGYAAQIEFDTDATRPVAGSIVTPGIAEYVYFDVSFGRAGNIDRKQAKVTIDYNVNLVTRTVLKTEPIPKFEYKMYSAGKPGNGLNAVVVNNWGNATYVKMKLVEFTLYTVDGNLLEKIAAALFKEIPEDPGTIFINKLIINPAKTITFNYEDENLLLQGLTRNALIYRYAIKGDDYLTTEVEIEQAYAANDEQQAQIIIERDTDVKNYVVNRKRAVA